MDELSTDIVVAAKQQNRLLCDKSTKFSVEVE